MDRVSVSVNKITLLLLFVLLQLHTIDLLRHFAIFCLSMDRVSVSVNKITLLLLFVQNNKSIKPNWQQWGHSSLLEII